MLKSLILALVTVTIGTSAKAATVHYSLQFLDSSDQQVGTGLLSFDPQQREDLYLYRSDEPELGDHVDEGSRYCPPATEELCNFYAAWTPIRLSFEIAGQEFNVRPGSATEMWLEGSYLYHGRYRDGGFRPGHWEFGDIYFNEYRFQMTPIDPALRRQNAQFNFFYDYDQFENGVFGRVIASTIPVPATWLLVLTSLPFFFGSVRQRRRP